MIDVRVIDLRGHLAREAAHTPSRASSPQALHWVCQPCRWGEHEACEYPSKICYCVECYGEEEQDE